MSSERTQPGFTLIELMIVVAIVAVLSSVAMVAFTRYGWRARGVEAHLNLEAIGRSAKVYWMTEHGQADGRVLPRQFPVSTDFPGYCCSAADGKCPGGRNADVDFSAVPTWTDLHVSVDDAHLFAYTFTAQGSRAVVTAEAYLGGCWVPAGFRLFSLTIDGDADGVRSGTVYEATP